MTCGTGAITYLSRDLPVARSGPVPVRSRASRLFRLLLLLMLLGQLLVAPAFAESAGPSSDPCHGHADSRGEPEISADCGMAHHGDEACPLCAAGASCFTAMGLPGDDNLVRSAIRAVPSSGYADRLHAVPTGPPRRPPRIPL